MFTSRSKSPKPKIAAELPAEIKPAPGGWATQVKVRYIGTGRCTVGDRVPGLESVVFQPLHSREVSIEQAGVLLAITQPRGGCCGQPAVLLHLFEVVPTQ